MCPQSASRRFIGGLVVTTAVIAVAASGIPEAQEVKKASRPRTVTVPITKGQFNNGNPTLTIDEGDTVVWVNKDAQPHSASRYTNEGAYDEGGKPTDQPFNTGFIQPGKKSPSITFLKATDPNSEGLEYACDVHEKMKGFIKVRPRPSLPPHPPSGEMVHHQPLPSTGSEGQRPALHSFVVTGGSGSAMFLHHYGLFNDPNHQFHVTLEARLKDVAARDKYEAYRRNKDYRYARAIVDVSRGAASEDHDLKLLPDLVKEGTFAATISHNGKLDWTADRTQWGSPIQGLVGVPLEITRIIQFRHFDPKDAFPASLIYQLYGTKENVFMAHEVTAAPSFLHVLQLAEIPSFLTPELIRKSPLVSIPSKRLKAGRARPLRTAVLSGNTNILLGPPTATIDFEPPLQNDEVVTVLIEGDSQPKQLKIGPTIFYDHRILNR